MNSTVDEMDILSLLIIECIHYKGGKSFSVDGLFGSSGSSGILAQRLI